MRLGFHMPISGGLVKSIERSVRVGGETLQIFTRSPRSWQAKPLDEADVEVFRKARLEADVYPLAVHLPYLPNLATGNPNLMEKSIKTLREELLRADQLGADFLISHPGHASGDLPFDEAASRIGRAAAEALDGLEKKLKVLFVVENTSGQKGELGVRFEDLALILEAIESESGGYRAGICLDTAHAFGAGYDFRKPADQDKTLAEFDKKIGLKRLAVLHLNDSLKPLGSCRDRHAVPGKGLIGARGLASLVRHPALKHLAGLMETPRETEENDLINLKKVKRWRSALP